MTMLCHPGPRNLITDVAGLRVGQAGDERLLTGVTVLLAAPAMVAAADIRGGAPGTRETEALRPENLVESCHAIVLSGGSVFGLDAASAVTTGLARAGIGFAFGPQAWPCPVVPAAILFDLANGAPKGWGEEPPYRRLGAEALARASVEFALGNEGAGTGAMAGTLKGGLGSASSRHGTFTVGALVAVNAVGSCVNPQNGRLWALDHAVGEEMGPRDPRPVAGLGGSKLDVMSEAARAGANTTISVVATDAKLSKAEALRLAIMAQDGLAIAIRPAHTPFDGDSVFAAATGVHAIGANRSLVLAELGSLAALTLARAVGRAIWTARSAGRARSLRDIIGA
jgi:L-aminopeptidase/D-esterase-like protein